MGKRKKRASTTDIQAASDNRLPASDADVESADEIMYGSGVNPGSRASKKRKSK